MDNLFYLTDVHGPRLANSPNYFAAADWVVKQMGAYGIDAREEKWGPFGTSWRYTKFYAALTARRISAADRVSASVEQRDRGSDFG